MDHLICYNRDLVGEFAATNILLAAAALATTRIRLDAQVTPAPRRRPAWLARETATLDRLSDGRVVLGVGLSDPVDNEYGRFGDRPGRRSIRRGSIAAPKRRRARGSTWSAPPDERR